MEKQSSPFGLIGWLEATRVVLPLKGVECQFAVCGDLLNVEIDQIFQQNNRQPLDCEYVFPLPAAAAVYRCEMHVNGRVIRARVEEAERARELVREKKAAGFRTALVEMERDNLFTLSLGNVQPGDLIVIRLAYFQPLRRLEDWVSFHIPFCPGVRYIPGTPLLRAPSGHGTEDDTDQVPDASRISPPRIDRLHPDAAYISIEGRIEDRTGVITDISSPSHPVVLRDGDGGCSLTLAAGDTVPDRDFVLRWTERPTARLTTQGWVWRGRQNSYALVRLQAPPANAMEFRGEHDVYFLLDRSGSMEGLKWQQTARAFGEFVRRLHPDDRVWLTLFESTFRDFAEKPLPARAVLAEPAAQRLEKLGTAGGTEMLPALRHVIEKISQHSAERPATLLLITDGQVGNEAAILSDLRRHPNLCVHTFGIDIAINDGLLQRMAEQQHGTSWLLSPNDDIVGAVARMAGQLRSPVATNLHPATSWDFPETRRIDLHAGESLCLCLCGPANGTAVEIGGMQEDGQSCRWQVALREIPNPAASLWWSRKHIDGLIQKGRQNEAIALAKAKNLICPGASFVAWDEAEKVVVSVSRERISQPVSHPASHAMMGRIALDDGICLEAHQTVSKKYRKAPKPQEPLFSLRDPKIGSSESFWKQITRTVLEMKQDQALPSEQALLDRLLQLIHRLQSLRQYHVLPNADGLFEALARWCAWGQSYPAALELHWMERRIGEIARLLDHLNVAPGNEANNMECVRKWLHQYFPGNFLALEEVFRWWMDVNKAKQAT